MEWFIKIPNAILQDKDLNHTQMILYGCIESLSKKKWYCYASNQALGEYIHITKHRVSNHLSKLQELGYIEIEPWQLRKIKVLPKTARGVADNSKGDCQEQQPDNNKEIKDISKDISIDSQCKLLVEAYITDSQLPKMMKDVSLVQERVEYKQAKKNRAYKTVRWFIQQMKSNINTVRNNDMRGDTELRFGFAVNQSMENEWKWIFRTDRTEEQYQARRKLYLLEQKQNE